MIVTTIRVRKIRIKNELKLSLYLLSRQIECSSISDYAVKIVKANKLDDG